MATKYGSRDRRGNFDIGVEVSPFKAGKALRDAVNAGETP